MEAIIFGSFFVLSLAAYGFNHAAKKTEQQRQSVSNVNFIRFQRSFFLVYFMALLGDWLQGPYVYKLYRYVNPKYKLAKRINFSSMVFFLFLTAIVVTVKIK